MKKFEIVIHKNDGTHKGKTTVEAISRRDAEEQAKKITHKGEHFIVMES